MVTRRTLRRTHLLRPDKQLNALYLYCLAVLAHRHGVQVHAVVLMSTHQHLVLTDVHGQLPRFLQELHRLVALGVKVLRKWEGTVWDHEKTSVVELLTDDAVIEKIAYVMANPVAAGLVERASDWPGVTTRPSELGLATWTVERPAHYFDASNASWPAVVTLQLVMPPTQSLSPAHVQHAVMDELEQLEQRARQDVRSKGWHTPTAKQLARLSPFTRARSWEPIRGRNPTFAVGRGQRAAFFDAVAALRSFRTAYRAALERWRRGFRDVLFPAGTWLMDRLHGAPLAPT
jgi:putative transposase